MDTDDSVSLTIDQLYRQRPRNRYLRYSACAMLAVVALSWLLGDFLTAEVFNGRRLQNLQRFLHELIPYPLQERAFDWNIALNWLDNILADRGWQALGTTLAISVAAIVMAGCGSMVFAFLSARNLITPAPFLPELGKISWTKQTAWRMVVTITRLILIFLRAIPEYVWAFLLLAVFGFTAWPIVLALALHNAGILGKLSAEIVENVPAAPLASLRALGASRLHIAGAAIIPMVLPRLLMFFFYRWETCVREATVLGLLGFVSLGFWIQDARARNNYDEMFLMILLGATLIMVGDLLSAIARKAIRDAG
jgi:phosphonate transport system permease protein